MVYLNIKSHVPLFIFFMEMATVTIRNKFLQLISFICCLSNISFYFTFSFTGLPELLSGVDNARRIEIMYEILPGITVGMKLLLVLPYFKRLVALMQAFDEIELTSEGKTVILKYVKKFQRLFKLMTVLWGMAVGGAIATSIVFLKIPIENQRIPLVYITEKLDWKFWLTAGQQDTYCAYALFAILFLDGYPTLVLGLISGYLEGISLELGRIGHLKDETEKESRKKLTKCIQMHQNAFELQEEFTTIYSKALLLQCALTSITICSTMVKLSVDSPLENMQLYIRNFVIVLSVLMQISTVNYMGSLLIESNEMLRNALFGMNWVDKSLKFKKILLMFQQRTQKLIQIRIGYIFIVDMIMVKEIVNVAYKLYAVMMNVNQ